MNEESDFALIKSDKNDVSRKVTLSKKTTEQLAHTKIGVVIVTKIF